MSFHGCQSDLNFGSLGDAARQYFEHWLIAACQTRFRHGDSARILASSQRDRPMTSIACSATVDDSVPIMRLSV